MQQKENNTLLEKGRYHLEQFQGALFSEEAEDHLSNALDVLEEIEFTDSSDVDKAMAVTVLETYTLKFISQARALFEAQRPPVEEDVSQILGVLMKLSETSLKTKYDFDDAWNKMFNSALESMFHGRITDSTITKVRGYLRNLECL